MLSNEVKKCIVVRGVVKARLLSVSSRCPDRKKGELQYKVKPTPAPSL